MRYFSLAKSAETEQVVKRSRFLGFARHVEGEDDALRWLDELQSAHPQATHICYAYVADALGNLIRFNDDGEPKGTAGMPILEIAKKRNLRCAAVAVVRYFGGVKLGAGGLVRAYADAAASAVDAAGIAEYGEIETLSITVDYAESVKLRHADECGRTYGETVTVTYETADEDRLIAYLSETLGGKPEIQRLGARFAPIEKR